MLDLGASINAMPKSVFLALGIRQLQPIGVVIQLANHSFTHPAGMIQDVLVKDLIFLQDFYILNIEGDTSSSQTPLILGRSFLKTARTKIGVHAGTLTMEFGDTMVQFNIFYVMRYPSEDHSLLSIDVFDELHPEELDDLYSDLANLFDCFNTSLSDADSDSYVDDNISGSDYICDAIFDECTGVSTLGAGPEKLLPFIVQPPKLELKALPDPLKYAYLGKDERLPVIIAQNLKLDQEKRLLDLLQQYQQTIVWMIADIPGIRPSICMHRIFLEDDVKSVRQSQCKLNPLILDVMKKEVTKLLQADIIYPISDSKWVSPMQVVPKKSSVTVVANTENELILT